MVVLVVVVVVVLLVMVVVVVVVVTVILMSVCKFAKHLRLQLGNFILVPYSIFTARLL